MGAAVLAGSPGPIGAGVMIYKARAEARLARENARAAAEAAKGQTAETAEARSRREIEEARALLSKQQAEVWQRQHDENIRLAAENAKLREENDRAWSVASRHYQTVRDMRHDVVNARTAAAACLELHGKPIPPRLLEEPPIPDFDPRP